MALSQSDLMRLLESLRSTDGIELVRGVAERMLQELIEAEATAHIGAGGNERTPSRAALRNGHRDKRLTTPTGDLDLDPGDPQAPAWTAGSSAHPGNQ
ncbi:transposase [Streptomyces sp. NPDC005529]|uniref:transposase n=1 Tax=unclassified Streptomyces TaxID=2593676 RepID=UPI0033BC3EB4